MSDPRVLHAGHNFSGLEEVRARGVTPPCISLGPALSFTFFASPSHTFVFPSYAQLLCAESACQLLAKVRIGIGSVGSTLKSGAASCACETRVSSRVPFPI